MPSLLDCPPGTTVRMAGIEQSSGARRLLEFGFVPGAEVTVIARGATGGLLVGIGDARVALDSRTASRLRHL
ncbi:FeoA family protein [Streptomyces sp. NBC_01304]|uniref:FeoA family protein n=1 Tax=Streptomyces sp. NBC_01304 TaxID=2903818 RepID=UPI002E0DB920|nr:ferrous iron transport protein A [Streptomyces sp. NBC_01304]